ncbi:hypothetical protein SRABI128_03518 [Microbacterium sp. Bi128]|nr:hypothetical protein SRABI128_03518 [Microbacterium sp. Bi128]
MCEALSPSAIRWERFGMAAVSPLEMPRWEGTRATLTRFPVSRLRVTTKSGCSTRWMGAFWRTSSALTESTRKGISSVTMYRTLQSASSRRSMFAMPGFRVAAIWRWVSVLAVRTSWG